MIKEFSTEMSDREVDLSILHPATFFSNAPVVSHVFDGEKSAKVTGIQKLCQRVLVYLLTAKGSQEADPEFGTEFYRQVTQGMAMDGIMLKHKFNFAALDALAYFRRYQKAHKDLPLDETLADIRLLSFSSGNSTLSLRIQVLSKAGGDVSFILPFPLP